MMSDRLHDALQDGLQALAQGQDLESARELHVGLATDLTPALEAFLALRALQPAEMPAGARLRSRARLQAAMRTGPARPGLLRVRLLPRFAAGLAAVALAVTTGLGGLAVATAQALPGDVLYPVKRASETVRLQLTLPSRARLELEDRYAMRRADEVRRLLQLGRRELVTFEGIVQGQSEASWSISDIRVVVPAGISLTSGIAPGMTVEVRGETEPEGHFLAEGIQLLGYQYVGPVLIISPEAWTVGGQSVAILSDTWIEPGIQVGQVVLVSVRYQSSGVLAGRAVLSLLTYAQPTSTVLPGDAYATATPSPGPVGSVPTPATDLPAEGDGSNPGDQPGTSGDSHEESGQSEDVQFQGVVETRSANIWVISGTVVRVDSDTEIEGDPQVGDTVRVEAFIQADGQLRATKIEKED